MPWSKELQPGMQGIPPKPRPAYAAKEKHIMYM